MPTVWILDVPYPETILDVKPYTAETVIRPEDFLVFSPSKWVEIKRIFAGQKQSRGFVLSPVPDEIMRQIFETTGIIKPISLEILTNNFDDYVVSQFFNNTHIQSIETLPIAIVTFDLRQFMEFVFSLNFENSEKMVAYLKLHPQVVELAAKQLRILHVNQNACRLYEAGSAKELIDYLSQNFHTYENSSTIELMRIVKNKRYHDYDVFTKIRTIKGNIKIIRVNWLSESCFPAFASTVLLDITNQELMLNELRTELQAFYTFFDNSPMAISIVDQSGKFIFVNKEFSNLLGYESDMLIGRNFIEFTHPNFIEEDFQIHQKIINEKLDETELIKKYIRRTGEEIWARLKVRGINDLKNGNRLSIAIIEDITDQKIVEEALEQGDLQYQFLFDNAPVGLIEITITENQLNEQTIKITSINKAGRDIFGLNMVDDDFETISSELLTTHPEFFHQVLSRMVETKNLDDTIQFNYKKKNGLLQFKVQGVFLPSIFPDQRRLVLYFTDVTLEYSLINEYEILNSFNEILARSSFEKEELFRRTGEFLISIFDSTIMFILKHPHGGFSVETLMKKSDGIEEVRPFKQGVFYEFPLFETVLEKNEVLVRKLGEGQLEPLVGLDVVNIMERDVYSIFAAPFSEESGSIGVIVMFNHSPNLLSELNTRKFESIVDLFDLTYSKFKILENLQSELNLRMLAEQKLMEQAEKLSSLNEDLEQFVYAASHDIQEPLRTIITYLDLISSRLQIDEKSETYRFFQTVINSTKRLRNLITDLRNYSLIGREKLQFDTFPLGIPVRYAINNLYSLIKEKNAKVNLKNPNARIYGNLSLMTTLFQNLISNGIKFNESQIPTIDIYVEDDNQMLKLIFEDNGIGIPEDQKDKIFKVLKRLHPSSKYEGSGMGLAISQKIIQVHNGKIEVETRNDGTRFILYLPRDDNNG